MNPTYKQYIFWGMVAFVFYLALIAFPSKKHTADWSGSVKNVVPESNTPDLKETLKETGR